MNRLTDNVTVATRAHKKLLQRVFILNELLISCKLLCNDMRNEDQHTSIENMTPPIGEPKATATPAALAAVTISLILPAVVVNQYMPWGIWGLL
jgi:hypothetical protein